MNTRTDHLTNTPAQAAEYEARQGENREAREPVTHVHYFSRSGAEIRCSCGEAISEGDAL